MGTRAMWSTERPLEPEGSGLPACALLDTEGKVLLKGNPLDQKKQIEEAIAAQVKKAKDPPAGTPAKLSKTWATFVKGNAAAAMAECDKLGAADASLTEAAKTLHAEMVTRMRARVERAKWLAKNGYPVEGRDTLLALMKVVAGNDELTEQVTGATADLLLAKGLDAEIEATKALTSLQ